MQIIGADFVVVCNAAFDVIKQGGICFDKEIIEVGAYAELCAKYQGVPAQYFASCVLMPALANLHLHLEFNQNVGMLHFGDFGTWLDSVIEKRALLVQGDLKACMQEGIKECLKSGVSFVGAISSYGLDLEVLANSPLRVLYFNEVIGSSASMLDVLLQDFLARFKDSKHYASARFIPAIAVHSPYSVHHKLLEKTLEIAKQTSSFLSVHFLESLQEREWLESGSGYFNAFYAKFFKTRMHPFYSPESFLEKFSTFKGVYFTHCLEANATLLAQIHAQKGKIITCPKSNRLLNNRYLDLQAVQNSRIPLCLGTDGKSSNDSLSLLDELRVALFAYAQMPLESLAKTLLLSVTRNAFLNTKIPLGELKAGNYADLALFKIPKAQEFYAHHFILYVKEAYKLYIQGVEIAW